LPVCTRPRFDASGSSREIDAAVKSVLRRSMAVDVVGAAAGPGSTLANSELPELGAGDALSVYEVFTERLRELQPTHIVTQAQCDVCAVSLRDVERAVREIADCSPQIISLQPNSLNDIWDDIGRVAAGLGVDEDGERLIASLRARMQGIKERAATIGRRPRVACIEWADPLMAAGNWTPELIEMAGGENLLGVAGQHSPPISFEDLAAADPDVIVIAPCGFSLERTREDMPVLAALPGWQDLSAVRHTQVFLADGNQYFNRPGPRVVETVKILAEILHPDVFAFGHEGSAWERMVL
jgi:iron complex transport system substrate-binding protein